jgi:hypothetical protein
MTHILVDLDFKICFDTDFSFAPLSIKFNSEIINLEKGKTCLPLTVSSIDQRLNIEFNGYVPDDKNQKIIVSIYYKNTKLDTVSLSTFEMKDNQYVNNVVLKDYDEICFNGSLTLQFFKSWFECNILKGSYINNNRRFLHQWVTDYTDNNLNLRIEKNKKNYDIMCFGCSFTYGIGVEKQSTWPYLLGKKLDLSVGNFGTVGMSIHGCFRQLSYCLKNYNTDKIIILLPNFERALYKFNFLNNSAFYNFTCGSVDKNLLYEFYDYKKLMMQTLKNSIRNGKKFINYFNKLNKKIYVTSWSSEVYASIPDGKNKLPQFPPLETFSERATDGSHPHKKHYELFVDSIIPHIQ